MTPQKTRPKTTTRPKTAKRVLRGQRQSGRTADHSCSYLRCLGLHAALAVSERPGKQCHEYKDNPRLPPLRISGGKPVWAGGTPLSTNVPRFATLKNETHHGSPPLPPETAKSNRGLFAYQPNALPLGQNSSPRSNNNNTRTKKTKEKTNKNKKRLQSAKSCP